MIQKELPHTKRLKSKDLSMVIVLYQSQAPLRLVDPIATEEEWHDPMKWLQRQFS